MPLTSAIQSAMAIRHEREKREQRRLSKIRRESGRPSLETQDGQEEVIKPKDQSDSSLTTFHMGVVFILLGFLMIFSSMIPSSLIDADWSRLLGVGVTFIFIGLLMVMVNRIITAREEEELSRYVKQRLSRTRSGHPFVREHEAESAAHLPSAMKKTGGGGGVGGAGGPSPSPRSPRDKVTFAEFQNEVYIDPQRKVSASLISETEINGILREAPNGGNKRPSTSSTTSASAGGRSGSDRRMPPHPIPHINITEPSPADPSDLQQGDDANQLEAGAGSISSDVSDVPPSPSNETQRLLPDDEESASSSSKRKIY